MEGFNRPNTLETHKHIKLLQEFLALGGVGCIRFADPDKFLAENPNKNHAD
jgi:hypothetical protein